MSLNVWQIFHCIILALESVKIKTYQDGFNFENNKYCYLLCPSVCLSQSVFSVVLQYLLPFQYGFHVKEFCKLLKLLYSNKSDAPSLLSTTVIRVSIEGFPAFHSGFPLCWVLSDITSSDYVDALRFLYSSARFKQLTFKKCRKYFNDVRHWKIFKTLARLSILSGCCYMISLMKRAIEIQLPDEPPPQDKHCQNTTSFCPLLIEYNGLEIPSFVRDDHMVQNLPSWMANGAVGHKKMKRWQQFTCLFRCFSMSHCASCHSQYSGSCTMWPSHAKSPFFHDIRRRLGHSQFTLVAAVESVSLRLLEIEREKLRTQYLPFTFQAPPSCHAFSC